MNIVFVICLKNLQRFAVGVNNLIVFIDEQHGYFAGVDNMAQHFALQMAIDVIVVKCAVGFHQGLHVAEQVPVDDADIEVEEFHQFEHGFKADLTVADVDYFSDMRWYQLRLRWGDSNIQMPVNASVC